RLGGRIVAHVHIRGHVAVHHHQHIDLVLAAPHHGPVAGHRDGRIGEILVNDVVDTIVRLGGQHGRDDPVAYRGHFTGDAADAPVGEEAEADEQFAFFH